MSGFETVMWRAEAEPRLRSSGVIVDLLDRTPEWDRLVAAHRWGISLIPRLRQRVIEDPLLLSTPAWSAAPVDLEYHLRRVRAPEPATVSQVLTIAEAFVMTPLDPARPLWEAMLIEGLADGTAAYLLKLHHCLTDGQATIQLFDLLHSDTAAPTPDKPVPVDQGDGSDGEAGSASRRIGASIGGGRRIAAAAAGLAAKLVARPVPTVASAVRWTGSLARVAGRPPAPPSPLMVQRGLSRRFAVLSVPLADLRAAGKAAGGSLNDAFLAALVGGLRRYHTAHGVVLDEVTIAFPVSLRDADHPLGGNRFSGARIAAPLVVEDPTERIARIRERVLAVRDEPALDFMSAVAPILARAPTSVLTRLTTTVTQSIDLQASNIPGLSRPAFMAGARITRMFPFGPAPGPAAMVTLISHDGTCCVGINMDASAIPDGQQFVDHLREGFNEVLSLVDVSVPPGDVVTGSDHGPEEDH
jgi:WS/DGAT/MGAT family acyltransferase